MAKQIKKALCVVLSVILALSCFAMNAFAFTGYDNNGENNNLSVQSVVTTDKASYAVDETVTATITLNHPGGTVVGFQGYLAFDASKLEYQSAQLDSGFEFIDDESDPASVGAFALSPSDLHNGVGGAAYTKASFASLLGTPAFSSLSVIHVSALNVDGVEAGTSVIANISFKATAEVASTAIALVPSNVYKSDFGFFDCIAALDSAGAVTTAFSAVTPSEAFEISGSASDVRHDITFNWHNNSETIKVKEGTLPVGPEVPDYSDGDYECSFLKWSPDIVEATDTATYTAQYTRTFVSADYDLYNAAVAAATAKRNNGTNWTEASLATLDAALNENVSGKGRTQQADVDAQVTLINNAADALEEAAAVYEITFVIKGESSTQSVTAGQLPQVPEVENYADNEKNYTFTGWKNSADEFVTEIPAVTGTETYTAQFDGEWIDYDITFSWNGDSKVVKTHWGAMPEEPQVPTYETATAKYVFDHWDPSVVACAGEASYAARYKEVLNTYTIEFRDYDGRVIQSQELEVGAAIIPPENPSREKDKIHTYTFAGWDPQPAATVSDDAVYVAQYDEGWVEYTVEFRNADGKVLSTKTDYHYGDVVEQPETPSKEANEIYHYTFKAWDPQVEAVSDNVIYTATYNDIYNEYNITFNWVGDSKTVQVHWGENPSALAPTVPSYEAENKTFSFAGWNPQIKDCDGDIVYEATYSSELIEYTITFDYVGGPDVQKLTAGQEPVQPKPESYMDGDNLYTFIGWNVEVVPVTGDATYTAQYSEQFVFADYSAVDAAETLAGAINRSLYTTQTLEALDSALRNVKRGKGITAQAEVDAWAQAITDAYANLQEKDADYTAYEAAVAALQEDLENPDYTPDSVAAVTQKLAQIDAALEKNLLISRQSEVNDATEAVKALKLELEEKADKGELESLITQVQALDPDLYIDFSAVETALAEAQSVFENANANASQVNNAIRALSNAKKALQYKPADYTAWNTLEESFADMAPTLRFYESDLVDAVKNVLKQVSKGENITYQNTLDSLTQELKSAMDALDIIRQWAGEKDFYNVDHEYFYSNLEFEKVVESNEEYVVNVYLNHPSDEVSKIQVAALYDASVLQFQSVEPVGGTIYGSSAGAASFDPTDYGMDAMGSAGVVKFIINFPTALAKTYASRDLIATLHFAPISTGSSIIKAVPLASNTALDKPVYSALYDTDGVEKFMHSEFVKAEFSGIITIPKIVASARDESASDITSLLNITLMKGDSQINDNPDTGASSAEFTDVSEGTYIIKIEAPGSLGYLIKNIKVDPNNPETQIPDIVLLFGDANNDGVIAADDIGEVITCFNKAEPSCDANVDGIVAADDIGVILLENHFGKEGIKKSGTKQFIDMANQ